MPIYEYVCESCGKPSEMLVSASQKVKCPHCNSSKLKRQFSVFAAHNKAPAASPCAAAGCPGAKRGRSSACAAGGCPLSH